VPRRANSDLLNQIVAGVRINTVINLMIGENSMADFITTIPFHVAYRLSCALVASTMLISPAVLAQQAPTATQQEGQGNDKDTLALEEIVVTAQKREESLQDVPASIQAVTGEKIAQTNIGRLEELATLVPNFSIQQAPIGDKINIRGIQSGDNAGLEQSVGTFVDGVYRGRGVQTRFAFLDLARVEVLRGPQGTLFGKNTIGGAINITSARPTQELSGALAGSYTFDGVREYEVEGHISGSLSDTIRARLAGVYRNLDRGYLRNLFYGGASTPTSEEFAFRGTIEADLSDATQLVLRAEYGDFDQFGQPFGNLVPGPLALIGERGNNFRAINIGSRNPVLDIGSNGNIEGDSFEASATLTHDFDAGTLTAIAAYSNYDFVRQLDADFSATDVIRFDDAEDFEQGSLEVRFASNTDGPLQYIAGGYLQRNKLVASGDTQFNVRGSPGELAIDTLLAAGCAAATAAGVPRASERNCILSDLVTAFDGTPLAFTDFGRFLVLDQKGTVAAAFAQVTYQITDQFALTGGLRYSYERKTATQSAIATNFGTRTRNDMFGNSALFGAFGAPDPFRAIGEGAIHSFNLERTENSVTYEAGAEYKPNDDVLLYATISSGFKAGGFNSFALGADPAEAEYEPEKATGVEVGGKFKLFADRAELNVAIFRSKFSDIQTAVFTGSTSFIVQNAAKATSQGIEVDGRLAVTDNLTLNASAAYVDFEFDEFPNAACVVDQLFQFRRDTNNPLATIQDCSLARRNNLAGRTSENTPKFSAAFGFNFVLPIGSFKLTTIGDITYKTKQFREADLDPTLLQEGFAKANLTFVFGPEDGPWDIALIGKNIFNKDTFFFGNDTPLLEGARQFAPDRPRTIALRARVKF
jgi:iron complex outermembrane recepter protein